MIHFIWEIIQETWVIILVFGIFIYFTTMFDRMNRKEDEGKE
jgi:hypothetical protein